MQQQKWIPIMAAAGIGAAAYCSMTRNGRSWGQTLQQMVPLVSMMGGMQNQQQAQGQMNQNQQGQSQQGMQSTGQQNGSMMVQ